MPKKRIPKTPEEIKEDLRNFDRTCTREFNKAMVRLAERLVPPPKGKRRPPRYKMKFPRFSRTKLVDYPGPRSATRQSDSSGAAN